MEKKTKASKKKIIKEHVVVVPAVVEEKKDEKPFVTYVLMFTIGGHKTWRISLFPTKADLDVYLAKQGNHPKLLEKRWFVVDRITGTITEEN